MFNPSRGRHRRRPSPLHTWTRRVLAATLAAAAVLGLAATTAAAHQPEHHPTRTCRAVAVPADYAGRPVTVRGTLCTPIGKTPSTVQLLVHGATYTRAYWAMPGVDHSPVRDATDAGYATLAIDRIGAGISTPMPALALHAGPSAEILHQLITALRAGKIGGHAYHRVALVGHSLGSALAAIETARHNDADSLVLTGDTNSFPVQGLVGSTLNGFLPAVLDPKFRDRLDPGYLTTVTPQGRIALFHAPDVPRAVTDADETRKDAVSVTEFLEAAAQGFNATTSRKIRIPTLFAVGDKDAIFCSALTGPCTPDTLPNRLRTEFAPNNPPATYLLNGAGHDIAMATNSQAANSAINHFIAT